MENSYGAEIERLKKEMEEMKEQVAQLAGKKKEAVPAEFTARLYGQIRKQWPDPKINGIMGELCEKVNSENNTGRVTYIGVFESSGRQSHWVRDAVDTDGLLKLAENGTASAVLKGIGNLDRLGLLLALLKKPMSVAQMVEVCGFNSTGQAYHHLNPLIAADLVREDEQCEKGVYAVKPHRVQGVIMLLAGIADLVDTKYSHGNWDGAE